MILSCNSCGKKFVVPDQAITSSGRMVQCGACGNKWKQFPVKSVITQNKIERKISPKKKAVVTKTPKTKKKKAKTREINLYSPEYLQKKHGINLNSIEEKKVTYSEKVSFGFYNSLIVFIFLIIALSRILYFSQEFIVSYIPVSEYYLNYFFESIRNIFEIWKNLITNY